MELDGFKGKILGIIVTAVFSSILIALGIGPKAAGVGGQIAGTAAEHLTSGQTTPTPSSGTQPAGQYRETAFVRTKGSQLFLRSAPSKSAPIVIGMPNGAQVSILAYQSEDTYLDGERGKWCQVEYNGKIGWAWGGYLQSTR